jgi:phospholipid-translocating ATPase
MNILNFYFLATDTTIKGRRDMVVRIRAAIQGLAICHNVTPVETEEGRTYQASSPDEIAIVRWTECVGLTLVFRDLNTLHLQDPDGKIWRFEVLHVFPFTSETKYMGIIVRDLEQDEIIFYMKGADVILTEIVEYNDWYVDGYI